MEQNREPQKNGLDAISPGNESRSEDIVIRRSSNVINSGKFQKQFDVFVADSMTTEYFHLNFFLRKQRRMQEDTSQTPEIIYVLTSNNFVTLLEQ